MKRFIYLILFIALTGFSSFAQVRPALPEKMKEVYFMAGKWKADLTYIIGKDTAHGPFSINCKKTHDGWCIECQEDAVIPGLGKYTATDIIGFDIGGGKLHLYTVSDGADCHDHIGEFDGKTATFEYNGLMDGKSFNERFTMTPEGKDKLAFNSTITIGGEVAYQFFGTFKRTK